MKKVGLAGESVFRKEERKTSEAEQFCRAWKEGMSTEEKVGERELSVLPNQDLGGCRGAGEPRDPGKGWRGCKNDWPRSGE